MRSTCVAIASLAALAGSASAGVSLPASESFDTGANGWLTGQFAPATPFASGGSDGGAYISSSVDFSAQNEGDFVTVFRAEDNPGATTASGGIFAGNYIASGVTQLSFDVRHRSTDGPVTFFTRFSPLQRFPGAIGVNFAPVPAGVWTTVTLDINPNNPAFVSFEGASFEAVFSSVSNLQFGIETSAGLAGSDTPVTFDIDNVRLIPTPASAALLGFAGLAARRRRG